MNEETINKLAAQSAELQDLPDELDGFALKKIFAANEDKFIFFTCTNDELHCALTAYYHTETEEFKLRESVGLTEFCLTNFFTTDFAHFKQLIDSDLRGAIKNLRELRNKPLNIFLREKKLDTWAYGSNLPAELEGFELFIKPAAPVEVTNGSFIILNYADFTLNSDFVIDFNIYTDEFGAERRINGAPHVIYTFDANTLPELEDKLKKNLVDELREVRRLSINA